MEPSPGAVAGRRERPKPDAVEGRGRTGGWCPEEERDWETTAERGGRVVVRASAFPPEVGGLLLLDVGRIFETGTLNEDAGEARKDWPGAEVVDCWRVDCC